MSEFVMPRYGAGLPKKSEQETKRIKEERPDCEKCSLFMRVGVDFCGTKHPLFYCDLKPDSLAVWVIYNTPECRAAYHAQGKPL